MNRNNNTAGADKVQGFADVSKQAINVDAGAHHVYSFDAGEGHSMTVERVANGKDDAHADSDVTVLINGKPQTLGVGDKYEGITGSGNIELASTNGGAFSFKTSSVKAAAEESAKKAATK